jgi:hypothetical protein
MEWERNTREMRIGDKCTKGGKRKKGRKRKRDSGMKEIIAIDFTGLVH